MGALMGGMSVTLRPKEYKNLSDEELLTKLKLIEEHLNLLQVNYSVVFSRFGNSVRVHINKENKSRLSLCAEELLRTKFGFYNEIGNLFPHW